MSEGGDVDVSGTRKRTSSMEECGSVEAAKVFRAADTCAYWLSKRNRNCLTKPVIGEAYCQVHLERAGIAHQPTDDKDQIAGASEMHHQTDADKSDERPVPVAGRCNFWLARKRRYCKLVIPANAKFCVEHSVTAENSTRLRIPCPKDPKHSCYADQLENHLKKCNSRDDIQPEYYEKWINAGEKDEESSAENKISIRDVEVEEVMSIIKIVESLHTELVGELETSQLLHHSLLQEVNKPENGAAAQKHLLQQASLIGHMDALGLLRDGVDYIEFGAGKGGLSHWVQLANSAHKDTQYILVDRSSCRYKKDNYHKGSDQGPSFQRLKIDIENLNLAKVPCLSQCNRPLVGIGKHLCGSATDLMLRCLVETAEKLVDGHLTRSVEGISLALCCHHRCEWKSFVGKHFFRKHGLSSRQFQLIVSMSAWATCSNRNEIDKLSHCADQTDYSHPRYGRLDAAQREAIGVKCKQLIDKGRIMYLADRGFDARLIYYVQRTSTLENVALVATRHQKPNVIDDGQQRLVDVAQSDVM